MIYPRLVNVTVQVWTDAPLDVLADAARFQTKVMIDMVQTADHRMSAYRLGYVTFFLAPLDDPGTQLRYRS